MNEDNPPEPNPLPRPIILPQRQIVMENPIKLVKHFRKYDGKSDVDEYLMHLKLDINEHQITPKWMAFNFDRVLEGQALHWFQSVSPKLYNEYGDMVIYGMLFYMIFVLFSIKIL